METFMGSPGPGGGGGSGAFALIAPRLTCNLQCYNRLQTDDEFYIFRLLVSQAC
jgi:hypothetical protein